MPQTCLGVLRFGPKDRGLSTYCLTAPHGRIAFFEVDWRVCGNIAEERFSIRVLTKYRDDFFHQSSMGHGECVVAEQPSEHGAETKQPLSNFGFSRRRVQTNVFRIMQFREGRTRTEFGRIRSRTVRSGIVISTSTELNNGMSATRARCHVNIAGSTMRFVLVNALQTRN